MSLPSVELIESIESHEGLRLKAYKDSVGVWTIGYGTNLQVLEIDEETAASWLRQEIQKVINFFDTYIPYINIPDQVRRDVILEMGYNMGLDGVLGFRRMWGSIANKNWAEASAEMMESKWATQVGKRAETLARRMKEGVY